MHSEVTLTLSMRSPCMHVLLYLQQDFFESSRSLSSGSCEEDAEAADYYDEEEDDDIGYEIDQAYVRKNGSSKRLQVVRLSGDYRGTFCSWYKDGMKVTYPHEHEACIEVLEDVCKDGGRTFEHEYL